MPTPLRRVRSPLLRAVLLLLPAAVAVGASAPERFPEADRYARWVEEMKRSPRGPFRRIRWFCHDGTIQPPRAYACADHGGGIQHGEWTDRVVTMREDGWYVGNVLAELEPETFTGGDADLEQLRQILVERFLRAADDGWIFRGARSYRGALQAEDEERVAREVVLAMLADPTWREEPRFLLLRETVRLFPLRSDAVSALEVRQQATRIAERDPGFEDLRAKIHGFPDGGDAERVRAYAGRAGKDAVGEDYARLAADIERLYRPAALPAIRRAAEATADARFADGLRTGAGILEGTDAADQRLKVAARLMAQIYEHFPKERDPSSALVLLQTSLELEREAYAAGNDLLTDLSGVTRRQRLVWLGEATSAIFGAGFVGSRHRQGVVETLREMVEDDRMSVDDYRAALRYLGRMPEWASRWMEFHFSEAVARFAAIEPKAHLYIQDRLRGSPLLFYGAVVDGLIRDANQQAGIEHELFGRRVGGGLRALNPGMARGRLYEPDDIAADRSFDRNGIFLLPETVSDLPPVGGILTRGEGSSLSHVQLLARNLGIPNVVVGDVHLDAVRRHVGDRAVLAVSPNGVVQLTEDGARWNEVFGREGPAADLVIRPDLEKLDLATTAFKSISELRASDSGRVSGPKGANLGELKHHFGDRVPGGFVIPFGAFRQVLEQPIEPGGPPAFEWMKRQYDAIAQLEGRPAVREKAVRSFLGRLRKWITTVDPGPEFRERLREALRRHFGRSGTYGVFVRSDTNVEDLPGFTGAGLNLTVPNVVGENQVLDAVRRVWASPFTERAFGWRQDKMEQPEYVFPAVVVQQAFASEKSGVMVTADVDTGDMDWITVAVNEGVGGAVDGQAAESLRIRKRDGEVEFLARATAPRRAVLDAGGGMDRVPATGTEAVLKPREIDALVRFAREVPEHFPALRDEQGRPVPADVEFAFKDGRLTLLQIRPFVESRGAKASRHLASLDASLREKGRQTVRLDRVPED